MAGKECSRGLGHFVMDTKEQISHLVSKLYVECDRFVEPLHPNILVRLLPRAIQTAGGLYLPEKQNKTVIEAVVLNTYRERRVYGYNAKSGLFVGDHVIMPHFVGAPVVPLDGGTGEYRLVKENEIIGRLDYQSREEFLRELTLDICDPKNSAEKLLAKYYITPKQVSSKITSGA